MIKGHSFLKAFVKMISSSRVKRMNRSKVKSKCIQPLIAKRLKGYMVSDSK